MSEAAATRVDRLVILRGTIEASLAGEVPVRDFAALSREYRAVMAEIDVLSASDDKTGDGIDEIAARREARRASRAKSQARAKRSS